MWWEKGENDGYLHFLLFRHQLFSKGFFTGSFQKSELWGNGLHSFLSSYLLTLPTIRHIHNFLSFTNVMYVCMYDDDDDDDR